LLRNLAALFNAAPCKKTPNHHFSNKIFYQYFLPNKTSNVCPRTEEYFIPGRLLWCYPFRGNRKGLYTPSPWRTENRFSVFKCVNTHLHFLAFVKLPATFTNVLVVLKKHLYKTATKKTSVMNLFMSVFIYKRQKEPDISGKI